MEGTSGTWSPSSFAGRRRKRPYVVTSDGDGDGEVDGPPRTDSEIPRRRDRRCPAPTGRGKDAAESDLRRIGRRRGRRPLSRFGPTGPPERVAATHSPGAFARLVERQRWATIAVVVGDRDSPRSCSGLDSIAEAIGRCPAANTARERRVGRLARSARAPQRKQASTSKNHPARWVFDKAPRKSSSRAVTPRGSRWGKALRSASSPSRWRAREGERTRRVNRRRVARDKECQRSAVSFTRGRQRRGEVGTPCPRRHGRKGRSSSCGVNRAGTLAEHTARCGRWSRRAERRRARRGDARASWLGEVERDPCAREWMSVVEVDGSIFLGRRCASRRGEDRGST